MLVVMEHRNAQPLAQLALHVEAVRRLDVFQVDPAERGFQRGDHLHQPIGVLLVHLDVEHIDAGELLEQYCLAFHHRLGGQRSDVAQAQHRGAVGDHPHQVAAGGVAERLRRVAHDFLARSRHPRRIRQRQVMLVQELLGRVEGNLAGRRVLVVLEGGPAQLGVAGGRVLRFGRGHALFSSCAGLPRARSGRRGAIVGVLYVKTPVGKSA